MGLERLAKSAHLKPPRYPEEEWSFFSNFENPQQGIKSLYEAFLHLRLDITGTTASFLDCGSGNGMAAEIALMATFNPVYGIEINPYLNHLAQKRLANLSRQQIFGNDSIHFARGSYYYQDVLPDIVGRCQQALQLMYQNGGLGDSLDFTQYVSAVLGKHRNGSVEALIVDYLQSKNGNPFYKLGIIRDQKLTIDAVYIYPSDVFFECAFLPQMGNFMRKGSLLAVLTPVDDCVETLPPGLYNKGTIFLQGCSEVAMCLQVFQKK